MIRGYDTPKKKVILGKSYKPDINLTVGSSSMRLYNELASDGLPPVSIWDPHVDGADGVANLQREPAVFFIGTRHDAFQDFEYPRGSVVIDPFGYIKRRDGVTVVPVGRQ